MEKALSLRETTIGKKVAMAASGTILLGFVVAHLLGNLNAFAGPQAFNEYANNLREGPMGILLWVARAGLLFAFGVHIMNAFELLTRNKEARKVRYQRPAPARASYFSAKFMYWSGGFLLVYVVGHLVHLTFGLTGGLYAFDPTNPYNNLVYGFMDWKISSFYILGNLALGAHLFHAVWSMFQTIGANHPKYNDLRRYAAIGVALLLTAGNLSFPILTMARILEPTAETFDLPNLR